MGTDEKEKDKGLTATAVDAAKGLALEVYKDAAKPAMGNIGSTIGGITKLLLSPLDLIARTGNAAMEKLASRIEKILQGVRQEDLQPPPPTIAAQASLQYALLGDNHEVEILRDMFAKLLATSMNKRTSAIVHPSFISLVSQLTSDEALLLRSIDDPNYVFPILEVRVPTDRINDGSSVQIKRLEAENLSAHDIVNSQRIDNYRRSFLPDRLVTNFGHRIGIDETRIEQYLYNLQRLRILDLSFEAYLTESEDEYLNLASMVLKDRRDNYRRIAERGAISLTPLGKQFLKSCVMHVDG